MFVCLQADHLAPVGVLFPGNLRLSYPQLSSVAFSFLFGVEASWTFSLFPNKSQFYLFKNNWKEKSRRRRKKKRKRKRRKKKR